MFIDKHQLLEDLFTAYFDARKHKRKTINQLRFEINFESNLIKLRDDLISGNYEIGKSICFVIDRPVKREILAADFRDRSCCYVLKLDISGYFMSINRLLLWEKFKQMIEPYYLFAQIPVPQTMIFEWVKKVVYLIQKP